MQNKYPLWKNLLLIAMIVVALIYSIPNLYGEDPAIQISPSKRGITVNQNTVAQVKNTLTNEKIQYKVIEPNEDDILIRFFTTDDELKAQDKLKEILGHDYTVAAKLASSTPTWLKTLGANPMKLGLDLRGGLHFLYDVDVNSVIARREQGLIKSISQDLREKRIRYSRVKRVGRHGITVYFRNVHIRGDAYQLIKRNYPNLVLTREEKGGNFLLSVQMSPVARNNARQYTIEQTMSILRNRVNELGVGEAVVQQQGATRIAVDLPGIQDAARAKQIMGGTATLEFHMVDDSTDARTAQTGVVPVGTRLYNFEQRPYLLKTRVILSGESITSAMATFDQRSATPAVSIQLGGGGESLFVRSTRANVGKYMSIVYVETKNFTNLVDGKPTRTTKKSERIISVARINEALGNNFIITGLTDTKEARDLALLLRAGALPANIIPVEERLIGPSLGLENVERGLISLGVGMGIVLLIMLVYYRVFGVIANIALVVNLIFLLAILSLIKATLTLPGIAGIVLTVGMAVDANVLIYERIREELRNGLTPQAAIFAGYERAFSTIVDANITTLIVAVVLFAVGTGPIQNFAVTLSIGLLTSMITSVMLTRAIVNFVYGGRTVTRLSVGI